MNGHTARAINRAARLSGSNVARQWKRRWLSTPHDKRHLLIGPMMRSAAAIASQREAAKPRTVEEYAGA